MTFQSAPVPKDERYETAFCISRRTFWFQSAPVPKDERYSANRLSSVATQLVSIRSRP